MAETDDYNHSDVNTNTTNVNIELAAREPWPTNACLYVPLKEQMILWAPDCLSSLCLLRKVRVPSLHVEHVRNAAEMSNCGIPPVLTLNNHILSEFDEIANFIELKGLLKVENEENTIVDSYSILCTEILGGLMKYFLLCEKAGPTVYQSFTSVYPWPLGLILFLIYRNRTIKNLKVKEIWPLSYEQALIKFETTVRALSNKIQEMNSGYLLGNNFTKADAHLYGHLYTILHTNISEHENLRNVLLKYKPLVDYVNNLERDVHGADGTYSFIIEVLDPRVTWQRYLTTYYNDIFQVLRQLIGSDTLIMSRSLGDEDGTYDGLKIALRYMLEIDRRGYVCFGSNIGNYRTDPKAENGGGSEFYPWKFYNETTNIYRSWVNLHYKLVPNLYSQSRKVAIRQN
ncbi:unnamed protein product, partial [Rotaria sp. Silwood1]